MTTKEIRRRIIRECVKEYIRQFPTEYKAIIKSVKKQRKVKKDVFGLVDKDSAYIRWILRIPERLNNACNKLLGEPRFLDIPGELNWFKKEFREFRVCEKT